MACERRSSQGATLPLHRRPAESQAEEISAHLRDYFNEAGEHLPQWMGRAVNMLPERGVGGRLLAFTIDLLGEATITEAEEGHSARLLSPPCNRVLHIVPPSRRRRGPEL